MDPAEAFRRVGERELEGALQESGDRFEKEDLEWHRRLRFAFLEIAQNNPNRCVVIPANQSEGALEQEIWDTVLRRFPELRGRAA
jgi:dTMP kinase